ncbi:MAG: hypothetical protein HYY43_02410 [Deltaproteobacteria bacterium]|nr:hypothetical protein [Deltaproteobacteria bacterium]MBI2974427.1 hypothetical protein [Deltaproteobacteria bacterium]
MSEELDVLKEVTGRLDKASISYMISGSVAMNFYAQPRMTRDIDIVVILRPENVKDFIALFEKDFYIEPDTVKDEVARNGMFNIIHNKFILKIDFIIQREEKFSQSRFNRRKQIKIDGVKMWIISAEDLILSKLLWAKDSLSEMQLKDVKNILSVAEGLDLEYMNKWADELGVRELLSGLK